MFKRTDEHVPFGPRDVWWHELMQRQKPYCPPEHMNSEDPLFLLYTSGAPFNSVMIFHVYDTNMWRIYFRLYRQAQGFGTHHWWLHSLRSHYAPLHLRLQGRRCVRMRCWCWLDHWPHLYSIRTSLERCYHNYLRKCSDLPGCEPLLVRDIGRSFLRTVLIIILRQMVEKHKITQFYTAPTAIRTLMKFGTDPVKKYDRY